MSGSSPLFDFLLSAYDSLVILDVNVIITLIMIIILPLTWSGVGRLEFHTKYFTKICDNNKILAADIFAHLLIEMGVFRNYMFGRAVENSPVIELPAYIDIITLLISYILSFLGVLMVGGAYWQLGIHGVYYGDYFGILMKERVTAFPYNVFDNPMYQGSQTLFFSIALRKKSPTGMFLTFVVFCMYKVASYLEMPMTELIYSEENRAKVAIEDEILEKERKIQRELRKKRRETYGRERGHSFDSSTSAEIDHHEKPKKD